MVRGRDWECPTWCKKIDFRTGKTPRYKFLSTSLSLELPKYYLWSMPTNLMGCTQDLHSQSSYGIDSNLWTPPRTQAMEGKCLSWSLSDSGWLWARSGLGFKEGGSGCCTDIVLRRWFLLRKNSGCEWRPKLPFLKIIRELFFLGREWRLNSSEAKWAA